MIYNITQDSSTIGVNYALRDMGVELTRYGDLEFDESKFNSVMATSASDVAVMLSADTDDQSKLLGKHRVSLGMRWRALRH